MKHTEHQSSSIRSTGYDPLTRRLEVIFTNGSTYAYHDVPADVHADLHKASSVGSFVQTRLRGVFRHTQNSA